MSSTGALGAIYSPSLRGPPALLLNPRRTDPTPWSLGVSTRASARSGRSHMISISNKRLLDMKPAHAWRSPHLGIRFSIDHKDRHWVFILRKRPICSPQPTGGRRAFMRHEMFSGQFVPTPSAIQPAPVLDPRAAYTITKHRQTRGFHANEEPRWIRCIRVSASKLYVLIL